MNFINRIIKGIYIQSLIITFFNFLNKCKIDNKIDNKSK